MRLWTRSNTYEYVDLRYSSHYFSLAYSPFKVEKHLDAGRYAFKTEEQIFSMTEYSAFVRGISDEIQGFKEKQALGVALEEAR